MCVCAIHRHRYRTGRHNNVIISHMTTHGHTDSPSTVFNVVRLPHDEGSLATLLPLVYIRLVIQQLPCLHHC